MLKTAKLAGLALMALGTVAFAPSAFARHGADDPVDHVRQEDRRADRQADRQADRAAEAREANDVRREDRREDRRADRANEVRHGADDPVGHQ